MLTRITCKGFTAICLGHIQDDHVVYLHLIGPRSAVKAIWATLSEKKNGYDVQIGRSFLRLERGARYRTFTTKINRYLDMVIIHPNAAAMSTESPVYLLARPDQDGPPPGFFPRLNKAITVPIKRAWTPQLWEQGQTTYAPVKKLLSLGDMQGYILHRTSRWWLTIVQNIIHEERNHNHG